MADDAYGHVGGGLKLKGLKDKKKKKKTGAMAKPPSDTVKNKMRADALAALAEADKDEADRAEATAAATAGDPLAGLTDSERAQRKAALKREADRIRARALKSHKDRVQELNRYLDGLSEHYDIPKVSWTK